MSVEKAWTAVNAYLSPMCWCPSTPAWVMRSEMDFSKSSILSTWKKNYFPISGLRLGVTHRLPMSSIREMICSDIDWNLSCTFCNSDWTWWSQTKNYFVKKVNKNVATHVNNQFFVIFRVHVGRAAHRIVLLHLVQISSWFWHSKCELGLGENFLLENRATTFRYCADRVYQRAYQKWKFLAHQQHHPPCFEFKMTVISANQGLELR